MKKIDPRLSIQNDDRAAKRGDRYAKRHHAVAMKAKLNEGRGRGGPVMTQAEKREALRIRREGMSCQVAFETLSGLTWQAPHTIGKTGSPNFLTGGGQGVHVQGRPEEAVSLLIEETADPDRFFVLGTGTRESGIWVFRGWMIAEIGQVDKYHKPTGYRTPLFEIPISHLMKMKYFPGLEWLRPPGPKQMGMF